MSGDDKILNIGFFFIQNTEYTSIEIEHIDVILSMHHKRVLFATLLSVGAKPNKHSIITSLCRYLHHSVRTLLTKLFTRTLRNKRFEFLYQIIQPHTSHNTRYIESSQVHSVLCRFESRYINSAFTFAIANSPNQFRMLHNQYTDRQHDQRKSYVIAHRHIRWWEYMFYIGDSDVVYSYFVTPSIDDISSTQLPLNPIGCDPLSQTDCGLMMLIDVDSRLRAVQGLATGGSCGSDYFMVSGSHIRDNINARICLYTPEWSTSDIAYPVAHVVYVEYLLFFRNVHRALLRAGVCTPFCGFTMFDTSVKRHGCDTKTATTDNTHSTHTMQTHLNSLSRELNRYIFNSIACPHLWGDVIRIKGSLDIPKRSKYLDGCFEYELQRCTSTPVALEESVTWLSLYNLIDDMKIYQMGRHKHCVDVMRRLWKNDHTRCYVYSVLAGVTPNSKAVDVPTIILTKPPWININMYTGVVNTLFQQVHHSGGADQKL
jgi:hypothetical protein